MMNSINVEGWKNPKYLDYNNTFNIIEETLNAFRNYEINNSILPVKFIDDTKNQEFNFYQLVKEGIALESYRFSLYSADVIIYLNMMMEESIESNDLLEVLQSLFTDTKTRLDFTENLYNKYKNNDEMNKILNSIREYEQQSLEDDDLTLTSQNPLNSCLTPLRLFLSSMKSNESPLYQHLLPNENENNENQLNAFQELMSKHEKGLNIICEIKQFWENQIEIISKFINVFEKGVVKGTKEIWLSRKDGQDIRNKWEEEKKNSEIFYHKICKLIN